MEAVLARPSAKSYQFLSFIRKRSDAVAEISRDLNREVKRISPKYFYDERGSRLFEQITATEDYYVTRAENEILVERAQEIADLIGEDCALIEPGCGNCSKVQYLLSALRPTLYMPIDISTPPLQKAARHLVNRFPWLNCTAINADFCDLSFVPTLIGEQRRVVFYPGSTIGNFEPADAVNFLKAVRDIVGSEGGLLIGVDLEKNAATLDRAYNDREGITADFNLNVLHHLNRIAGSSFSVDSFEHLAFYDSRKNRVEMHLRSIADQTVEFAGSTLNFSAGETIHTENSYKYSTESFSALAAEAGFIRAQTWYDSKHLFSMHYFVADDTYNSNQ
ncbi:MAG: Methyltransferase [Verrucomicrobiaceae bacterium]|nr:Methyltransferase [Verrucomicrobiaceae bacterium]